MINKTVANAAEAVKDVTGTKAQITFEPLPKDDPKRRCPDITKARQLLNWEPQVNLKTGLGHTVDYYKRTQFTNR